MADSRVLLLSDCGAGKSSLIAACVKQCGLLQPDVAKHSCQPAVSVPAKTGGSLYLIDSPCDNAASKASSSSQLSVEIARANAVLLLASCDEPDAISRLQSHWLPLIQKAASSHHAKGNTLPIVLALSKLDKIDQAAAASLLDSCKSIMLKYQTLESIIAYSLQADGKEAADRVYGSFAHDIIGSLITSSSLNAVQSAIHAPLRTVYDLKTQTLTSAAAVALARIHKLILHSPPLGDLDISQSMYLRVYGNARGSRQVTPDESTFVEDLLARLRNGQIEQVWRILNFYDYDRELRLLPASHVSTRSDGTEGLELSEDGVEFSKDTFLHYSDEKDLLQADDLTRLYALLPRHSDGCTSLTQRQWLDSWIYLLFRDPKACAADLCQLGYRQAGPVSDNRKLRGKQRDISSAFKRIHRHPDRQTGYPQTVHACLVVGGKDLQERFFAIMGSRVLHCADATCIVLESVSDFAQLSSRKMTFSEAVIRLIDSTEATTPSEDAATDAATVFIEALPARLRRHAVITIHIINEKASKDLMEKRDAALSPSGLVLSEDTAEEVQQAVMSTVSQSVFKASATHSGGRYRYLYLTSALVAIGAVGYIIAQRLGWLQDAPSSTSYSHTYVQQPLRVRRP